MGSEDACVSKIHPNVSVQVGQRTTFAVPRLDPYAVANRLTSARFTTPSPFTSTCLVTRPLGQFVPKGKTLPVEQQWPFC